jgi:hypothetical protein
LGTIERTPNAWTLGRVWQQPVSDLDLEAVPAQVVEHAVGGAPRIGLRGQIAAAVDEKMRHGLASRLGGPRPGRGARDTRPARYVLIAVYASELQLVFEGPPGNGVAAT